MSIYRVPDPASGNRIEEAEKMGVVWLNTVLWVSRGYCVDELTIVTATHTRP